jgi:adenosylmethionine-8-amino-7-oxononanoate aminotransferase
MLASEHEKVIPDMMLMAKGLSGGYLPLAITLISEKIFSAFDGSIADGKALAYEHSHTRNALACTAAKASLEVFENERIEAQSHGLLTRPLGNVIVLMPPLCITIDQITKAVDALRLAIIKVWDHGSAMAGKNAKEITA